jgi:acetyl-CoA carboxylase alpha subunit
MGANVLRRVIRRHLRELTGRPLEDVLSARLEKFRAMGEFDQNPEPEKEAPSREPLLSS